MHAVGIALETKGSPDVSLFTRYFNITKKVSLVWVDPTRKKELEEYGAFQSADQCNDWGMKEAATAVASLQGPGDTKLELTPAGQDALAAVETSSRSTVRGRAALYRDSALVMGEVCSAPRTTPTEIPKAALALAARVRAKVGDDIPTTCSDEVRGITCWSHQDQVACPPQVFREYSLAYGALLQEQWVDEYDHAKDMIGRMNALSQVRADGDARRYDAKKRLVVQELAAHHADLDGFLQLLVRQLPAK